MRATVEKMADDPKEANNIVFSSTLVMNGDGYGVVIRTGDDTMIGSIAGLAADTSSHLSTLVSKRWVKGRAVRPRRARLTTPFDKSF